MNKEITPELVEEGWIAYYTLDRTVNVKHRSRNLALWFFIEKYSNLFNTLNIHSTIEQIEKHPYIEISRYVSTTVFKDYSL